MEANTSALASSQVRYCFRFTRAIFKLEKKLKATVYKSRVCTKTLFPLFGQADGI